MSEAIEKKYTLRAPKADDMWLMLKIISKAGLKNVRALMDNEDVKTAISGAKDQSEETVKNVGMVVGMEVAGIVMERLEDCKREIYQLLGKLSGMKAAEIGEMAMADFAEMVIELVQMEEFRDFFTVVMRSLKLT